jgi:hypothetical protein
VTAVGRRQLEHCHRLHQFLRLRPEAAGGCGHFFDQRRILLRHLVHLHHRFAHLGNTGGLRLQRYQLPLIFRYEIAYVG